LNLTTGHGYLSNQTFDLSQTVNGIAAMTFAMDFDATDLTNWKPMILIGSQQSIWIDPGTNNPSNGTSPVTVVSAENNANWNTITNDSITNVAQVDKGLIRYL
jgi:hypothetical protein